MNKMYRVLLIILFQMHCTENSTSYVPDTSYESVGMFSDTSDYDTLPINISSSQIHWKGTKMRGSGKHEGNIQLQSAYLLTRNDSVRGGSFVIDMNSMNVTDIPITDPIPRERLINHLKSADFFDVEHFPTAALILKEITYPKPDSLLIMGELTMKSIPLPITFGAKKLKNHISTRFTIDRFRWNIAYEGNWVDRTLVDKDIELTAVISLKNPSQEILSTHD